MTSPTLSIRLIGAGPAVAAVHGNEIGGGFRPALDDQREELVEPTPCADHRLEADRQPRDVADVPDHVEQVGGAVDFRVPIRADRVLAFGDSAYARDLGGHLFAREYAALAGLRSLAELQLEHADRFVGGDVEQPFVTQPAMLVPDAVLRRADLEHEVAAAGEMPFGQSALAGVKPVARDPAAFRQGEHGRPGQCAVAHCADVEEGRRIVGSPGVRADALGRGSLHFFLEHRVRAVDEDRRAGAVEIQRRPECDRLVLSLCSAVDPGPLRPVEWHLFPVQREHVLAQKLAEAFEQVAEAPDDREIPADRVPRLRDVDDEHDDERQQGQPEDENEYRRQPVEHPHGEVYRLVHRAFRASPAQGRRSFLERR
jgi:hypothetical protein